MQNKRKGKNLVINARAETVLDKPSFSNGIWYHRIVIPASGFYEWNRLTKVSKNSPSSTGGRGIAEKRKKNACSAVRSVVYYNQSKG